MKRTLFSIVVVMLLALTVSVEGQDKKSEKKSPKAVTKSIKSPEGTTAQSNNKATLKSGYQFEKQSGNMVAVRKAGGGITGSFSCTCNSQGSDCSVSIEKEVITCIGSCTDCRFTIVINPLKAQAVAKDKVKKTKN